MARTQEQQLAAGSPVILTSVRFDGEGVGAQPLVFDPGYEEELVDYLDHQDSQADEEDPTHQDKIKVLTRLQTKGYIANFLDDAELDASAGTIDQQVVRRWQKGQGKRKAEASLAALSQDEITTLQQQEEQASATAAPVQDEKAKAIKAKAGKKK